MLMTMIMSIINDNVIHDEDLIYVGLKKYMIVTLLGPAWHFVKP